MSFAPSAFAPHTADDRSVLEKLFARPGIFLSLVFGATLLQVHWFCRSVMLEHGGLFPRALVFAFALLAVNVSILAIQAFYALLVKVPSFPKAAYPAVYDAPVAMLYCLKNEPFGLGERVRYSLENNLLSHLHLWLLSDSDEKYEAGERGLAEELGSEFGRDKIFYRRRKVPYERKQGNLKDWLTRFGASYKYFIVCDADSLLPAGWAGQALSYAEHPRNARIGIFQSAIYITHEQSLYARMQAIGQFYAQRLYFAVNQAVLGRTISFGHNQLVRTEAFKKIILPNGILSHDNWETALLDREGYRVAFIYDLVSYEEAPAHYFEERKRSKRWLKGTLQGWPLLFLSGISISTRFLIFYQIYLYFVQPLLFFWIVAGFILSLSPSGPLPGGQHAAWLLYGTLGFIFLHKFAVARNFADVFRIAKEILFTTFVGLQNIFYNTLDWMTLPLETMGWVPMAKNPSDRLVFSQCLKGLFPGTAAGLLFLCAGIKFSSSWTLYALPVIASLIFSIPMVYYTAKRNFSNPVLCSLKGEHT